MWAAGASTVLPTAVWLLRLALYPVRVYAFFAEGVYSYDAKARKLVRVAEGDLRRLASAQDFVYAAPLNLVYIADMSAYEGKNIQPNMSATSARAGRRRICRECEPSIRRVTGWLKSTITRGSAPKPNCSRPSVS